MAPSFVPGSAHTPKAKTLSSSVRRTGIYMDFLQRPGSCSGLRPRAPMGLSGGLIWGIAVDDGQAYYTAVNSLRTPWELQDGTKLSNAAFGAASLLTGKIAWETPVPRNGTSQVMPSVVNDVVFVGTGGPYQGLLVPAPPGSLLALDKYTGEVIKETILDTYFQGGIAIAGKRVFFGTGYSSARERDGEF